MRFAVLYFIMLIIFVVLIVGPVVAGRFLKSLPTIPLDLLQPTGLNNNDTSSSRTGSALNGLGAEETGTSATSTP